MVVAVLIAAHLWQNEFFPQLHFYSLWGPYFFGVLPWVGVAAVGVATYRKLPAVAGEHDIDRRTVFLVAGVIGCFIVALRLITGMLSNFGTSPFAHTPQWLLINAFFAGVPLVAIECSNCANLTSASRMVSMLPFKILSTYIAARRN